MTSPGSAARYDAEQATVRWFPHVEDPELERVHAAAAAGEYVRWVGPERPRDLHPPLRAPDFLPLRWPRRPYLDRRDERDPARQLPHARRAIERAKQKAGLFAGLQAWPTPEERVATFRRNAEQAHERKRQEAFLEVREVRRRLRELPGDVRRAVIVAWNARSYPHDRALGFIDRFLRGEVPPVPPLELPSQLLILGCTATRNPNPARMPSSRRFVGHAMALVASSALHGRGLAVHILTAELGLLHTWRDDRNGQVLGPSGPVLAPARAAELALDAAGAERFLHRIIVGQSREERPPYRRVFAGGGELHQQVVQAWEAQGAFRGAPVVYLPTEDLRQRDAICAIFGNVAGPLERCAPAQLPLL